MRKLAEVEEAKALMTEAMAWSVMKWLREKKRVRKVADVANATLDACNKEVKSRWSDELKAAHQQCLKTKAAAGDGESKRFLQRVLQADEEARRARQDAEDTFDEAERQLSTRLAREGCKKALHQWELDERAIKVAEDGLQ